MCRFGVCSVIEVLVGILDVVYRSVMTLEKLKELINAKHQVLLTERDAMDAVHTLLGFFETLLEIEKDKVSKMAEGPGLNDYLTSKDLEKLTTLKVRFWEGRRISGDGPPYISISKRAVRYKWGDVLEWLEKRKINNTAQSTVQK